MRKILFLFVAISPIFSVAQVGIGTNSPHPSAQLEVKSSGKGLLPPRVALQGTDDASKTTPTIPNPIAGLLVYNTTAAGSGATAVTAGFYYYNGTAWVKLVVPTDNASNVTGTVAVENGGTGGIDAATARTNLGLGNVDNTSDANKPISTATQTALNSKAPINNPTFTGTVGGITKTMVGLENVDNTSDANKPISSATQTALNLKVQLAGDLTGTAALPVIANGAINSAKLADGAVTTTKITNANITTDKIADAAITDAKISSISGSKVIGNINGNAANVTGMVAVGNGGTGTTSSTGSGSVVLSGSPLLSNIRIQTISTDKSIDISGNSSNASTINLFANDGSTRYGFIYTDATGMQVGSASSLPLRFMIGGGTGVIPVEHMRLTNDGRLGIGTTAPSAPLGIATSNNVALAIVSTNSDNDGIITLNANTNNNFTSNWHEFIAFQRQGTTIGSISSNGSNNVQYVTWSDYRLKEDYKSFHGLDLINKLKVYDYAWKTDKSRMFGFKAHEIQEVLPYAVTGKKDEVDASGKPKYQMLDYSKLTPVLVKAVQEQQEIISKQNERIEKLEKLIQQLINQKD